MFWKDEPITQIDTTNLRSRVEVWHKEDEQRRVKRNSLKPPPAKKEFLTKPGNWRYGNKSVIIQKPPQKQIQRFEVASEVETGYCQYCSTIINHNTKFCDKRCEYLFKQK